ncbi:MAG: tyrosine-type recombinase/integrase [Candidatus Obscuribacterales bacterium]
MPKLRLTKDNIQKLRPVEGKETFYWDTKCTGFGLRVTKTSMTYVVQTRLADHRIARVKIGRTDVLTLEQAEKQARSLLGRIALGEDPNAERVDESANKLTLRELYEEYKSVKKLRPKTVYIYDGAVRRCFEDWLDKPVVSITKDMVQKRHYMLSNANGPRGKGEAQANQGMRVLRSVLNYGAIAYEDSNGKSLLGDNPVRRLSQTRTWNKIPRRQDVISLEELEAWYTAVVELENDIVRDYLLLCLFTGLRRSEAMRLKWKDIDLEARVLLIPAENTKADRMHGLPLSDFLCDLLRKRARSKRRGNDYVFPARDGDGHMVEPKRVIDKVKAASGVNFSMHTLRRTFETCAERLDISYYALKKLLNHSTSGDVTSGYIVIGVERLREPMQKITDFIRAHAGA